MLTIPRNAGSNTSIPVPGMMNCWESAALDRKPRLNVGPGVAVGSGVGVAVGSGPGVGGEQSGPRGATPSGRLALGMPLSQVWNTASVGAQSPAFSPNIKSTSAASPVRLEGSAPVNWFLKRYSASRLERRPSSAGISPFNWLPERARIVRFSRVAELRRYLPAQLVAGEGQDYQVFEGCPVPPVSARSTGCPGGTALANWKGGPAPPVSARSTGFRLSPVL